MATQRFSSFKMPLNAVYCVPRGPGGDDEQQKDEKRQKKKEERRAPTEKKESKNWTLRTDFLFFSSTFVGVFYFVE